MSFKIFSCFLLSSVIASCQVHWSKTTDWTLYGYQGRRMFDIPVDSLNSFATLKLNQDTVISYLSSAEILKDPVIWMGGYVTTCKVNGEIRKIEFSNYGNFFYDDKSKSYYQLPSEKIETWLSYLQQSLITLAHRRKLSN
jgi:hypothetical protein